MQVTLITPLISVLLKFHQCFTSIHSIRKALFKMAFAKYEISVEMHSLKYGADICLVYPFVCYSL